MQWDSGDNAGFCDGGVNPWLPVHENYRAVNVQTEMADDESILHIYRKMLHIRKESWALQEGTLELIEGPDVPKDLLAYRRESSEEAVLTLINFGKRPVEFHNRSACINVLLTVGMDRPSDLEHMILPPYSGVILRNS
jgi:alpha-glucosidase